MLRTIGAGSPTLWESILPSVLLGMPVELAGVDRVLEDPGFVEVYRGFFHARLGRPSVPIETYLRLMFLKYRYRLGFEALCREVADSITWQRFCRIPLGGAVPHPSTLMKITTRCGASAVEALNATLVAKAQDAKVLRLHKVRADTTVVEANVAYPVDSRLWPMGSLVWPVWRGGSRRSGWRPGLGCGTGFGPRPGGPIGSSTPCVEVDRRPASRCIVSTPRSRRWPEPASETPRP